MLQNLHYNKASPISRHIIASCSQVQPVQAHDRQVCIIQEPSTIHTQGNFDVKKNDKFDESV